MAAKDPIEAMRARFEKLGYDGDKMIAAMKDPAFREAFNAQTGPLDGATVTETPGHIAAGRMRAAPLSPESRALLDAGLKSAREEPAVSLGSFTADVENDGDRGPRPSRDPMAAIDQAADAQRAAHVGALMSAVASLHVDEVRVLAWVAWQLPGSKLRRKCEEATATGWCRTEDPRPTARSTPEDRARAALLAAWRQVVALVHGAQSTAARDVAQRDRGDVLADEAARRAGGGE